MSFCQGPWSSSDSITNDLCDLGQDPVLLRSPVFPPSEWIGSGDKIFTSTWHWIGADARGVQLPLVFLRWHYPATCSQPEASRAGVKMTWHHSNPDALPCYAECSMGGADMVYSKRQGGVISAERTGRETRLILAKHPTLPLSKAFRTFLLKILKLPFW